LNNLPASKNLLIESMDRQGMLAEDIKQAFLAIPREEFVPNEFKIHSYDDCALPLEQGATLSQPSMLAIMLSELRLQPGMKVLEVGSGSGYLLALMKAMGANVTGVEIIESLAETSRKTLEKINLNIEVITGDASAINFPEKFDRVVFSAAVREIPHWATELLNPDGFVLAPVGTQHEQQLIRAYQNSTQETGRYCRFVPFIS
jgi:protein-L-isoaspartate(D-aspartate) O-methyltransferase